MRTVAARFGNAALRRVDERVWRALPGTNDRMTCLLERVAEPCAHFPTCIHDTAVKERMEACKSWGQNEYIHSIRGDLLVEPVSGFVVLPGFRYVPTSLPYAYQAPKPSALGYLAARNGLRPALELDRVISFRDVHEHNYFHFFNDVLTKIPLLEEAGLLDAPVLIGARLFRRPFFQAAAPALSKAGLRLVDQGSAFVHAKEVVFCKSMPYTRTHIDRVLDLLDVPYANALTGTDKVFLMRSSIDTRQRLLANTEEVLALVRSYGFDVVDPGHLPLKEQMALLGNTRHLITIHGAGATNMIFRRGAPLDVLELFPAENIPPHYFAIANSMGHGSDGLACGPSAAHGQFQVPIERLRTAMERLLARA